MTTDKSLLTLLKICSKLKPDQLESVFDTISDNTIDKLCECVFNVIHSEHVCAKLPKGKVTKLKKHIKANCNVKNIKRITDRKVSISKRRKLMKQEGKGLGLILSSVIPFLTSLFMPKS